MNINQRYVELTNFRESFYNVKYSVSLKLYLRALFKDLALREHSTQHISKYSFTDLFDIQIFIAEKLYNAFNKSNSGSMEIEEFCEGIITLFFGELQPLIQVIYRLFDFNSDGEINKEDVKIVLSHIPQTKSKLLDEKNTQQEYFKEIEEIINIAFTDKIKINISDFSNIVQNKCSDILFLPLSYLYKNIPFHQNNLNIFKLSSNEDNENLKINSLITFPSRNTYSGIYFFNFVNEAIKNDSESSEYEEGVKLNKVNSFSPRFKKDEITLFRNFKEQINSDVKVNITEDKFSNCDTMNAITKCNSDKEVTRISKFDIDETKYDGEIYKLTEKTNRLKRFYLSLINKDIYYYKDHLKNQMEGMHNLSGCFVEEDKQYIFHEKKYYSFKIIFPKKTRVYFTGSHKSNIQWISKIRKVLNYRDIFDLYEFKHAVGKGKFGQIILGINKETKEKVAIKVLSKRKMTLNDCYLARTEIDIAKFCKHPNIVRFIDSFENYSHIFIVLEYLQGGDLKDYIYNMKIHLKEEKCVNIIKQIGLGIEYLHCYGIMHRDLKPENIMISNKSNTCFTVYKIIDFGLSKIMGSEEISNEGFGTMCYVAPEILLRNSYDKKVDIFSLGIVLYYILSKFLPFNDENDNDEKIMRSTLLKNAEFPSKYWSSRSKESMELVNMCLCKNGENRININQFLENKWVSNIFS